MDRVGAIYKGYVVHRDAKPAILTILASIVRRVMLGSVLTFGVSNPLVQFFYIHFSTIIILAMFGLLRPLETRSALWIELGSQFLILLLFSLLLCHTGLVSDLDVRYWIGWGIVALTVLGIMLNFGNVLWNLFVQIRLKIKIWRLKQEWKKR